MKIIDVAKSHKIVTATLLVGAIGSSVGLAVINQPREGLALEMPRVSQVEGEKAMMIEEPEIEEVQDTAKGVEPVITPQPAAQPEPVTSLPVQEGINTEQISRDMHTYIIEVTPNKNRVTLQNVMYRNWHILVENDYESIIDECLVYIDANYPGNSSLQVMKVVNDLSHNVVAKYAN